MVQETGNSEWVEAALAEYEAHRAEVLAEAAGQQQTLVWGATAIGIVVAGAFNVWDNRLLATVAFLAAIPLLSVLILVQWAGRALGLMRVGVYLEGLERALRDAFPAAPSWILMWERGLAEATPQKWWRPSYEWNDFGAIAVFTLLSFGSIGLGAYRGYDRHDVLVSVVAGTEAVLLVVCSAALLIQIATVRQRVRQARKDIGAQAESRHRDQTTRPARL